MIECCTQNAVQVIRNRNHRDLPLEKWPMQSIFLLRIRGFLSIFFLLFSIHSLRSTHTLSIHEISALFSESLDNIWWMKLRLIYLWIDFDFIPLFEVGGRSVASVALSNERTRKRWKKRERPRDGRENAIDFLCVRCLFRKWKNDCQGWDLSETIGDETQSIYTYLFRREKKEEEEEETNRIASRIVPITIDFVSYE